ncbi:RNA polymerase subunit sigma-24 [Sphingobium sp. AEW4]|nr:RNA polymerase subunit sigma-24 [Sphingobium sp. AEW4]
MVGRKRRADAGSGASIEDQAIWRRLVARLHRFAGDGRGEDHLHNAFIRLQLYQRDKPVHDPVGFVIHAARNSAIDEFRRNRFYEAAPGLRGFIEEADATPLADEQLIARQRLERLRAGIDRLPDRTRAIFVAHRLEHRKYREIAQDFHISISAVEKHIARASLFLAQWSEGW